MKILVVVETTVTGYSAYCPDLAGCAATGSTRDEVEAQMQEGIKFHLEGIRSEGHEVPPPQTYATYVEVAAEYESHKVLTMPRPSSLVPAPAGAKECSHGWSDVAEGDERNPW